ncbi:hypothetical protein Lalb_Chr19g0128281 [Lupinus albus]|uniref:Secreted protein n=1 Tax=Lupinus albus TaxID=3870 RepID=A0A6A4NYB4_LUPAL|nr:hypothetical protein Lalb_Chr19g0128281 [Lupinus albus]
MCECMTFTLKQMLLNVLTLTALPEAIVVKCVVNNRARFIERCLFFDSYIQQRSFKQTLLNVYSPIIFNNAYFTKHY